MLRTWPIALSQLECRVLEALFRAEGEVVGTEYLIARVWPDAAANTTSLRALIGRLRQKLGQGCIETIGREGYRWVGRSSGHSSGGRIRH